MTEDVWRTKAAKQHVQSPQSHRDLKQIVCHSTLQRVISTLMICLFTAASVWADFQAGMEAYKRGDYKTALQELQPLAKAGHVKAQLILGSMYYEGDGVPQDYGEAFKWWRKAALQGHVGAQYMLGQIYYIGLLVNVQPDRVTAHAWHNLASAQGDEKARESRDRIAEKMTPAQIAEAQRLARQWKLTIAEKMTPTQIAKVPHLARKWPRRPKYRIWHANGRGGRNNGQMLTRHRKEG